MRNLRLWKKLAVIGGIFMLPFAVVTYVMISSVNTLGTEFARQEIRGVEYYTPVRALLRDLQEHRGLTAMSRGGDALFKTQLEDKRRDIETRLDEIAAVHQRLERNLDVSTEWTEVNQAVRALLERSGSVTASESFALHTGVIEEVVAMITRIGDLSNLTLDPDLDSYYLMNLVVFQAPELAEFLAQARGLGGAVAVSGSATPEELERLNRLAILSGFLQAKVTESLSNVTRANGSLKGQMENDARAVARAAEDASAAIASIVVSGGRDMTASNYFSTLTRSVDAIYEVEGRAAEALQTLLARRVAKFTREVLVTLGWALLGLLVVTIVGVAVMRDVTRSLMHVVEAANQIAVGRVDIGTLTTSRKDEIGVLAAAFDRMAASSKEMAGIAERIAHGDLTVPFRPRSADDVLGNALSNMVQRLSSLVSEVQQSGRQVDASATEIATTAKQQQATASEIAATTAEIGATSKEISATSRELVKTMSEVSAVAEESAGLASSGQIGLTRMGDTMRHVMDAASSINAKLAVLNEKAGSITQVVTTITKVADQTNLLSLNAAIEAEKAGEYGRGFAVVATEIRRLADQTAVATYDIERMVKEIQSAVTAGVMGMDKFAEEVRRGMEDVQQVGGQLSQIIQHVQTLAPRCESVTEGMQAQATGAEQITEALAQLSDAAHQTVQSLRQSNQVIDGLNRATTDMRTGASRFNLAA